MSRRDKGLFKYKHRVQIQTAEHGSSEFIDKANQGWHPNK